MSIQQNISLQSLHTFGIDVRAQYFYAFENVKTLQYFLIDNKATFQEMPVLILGGGSNILFTKDFEGVVLKNNIQGIEIEAETEDTIFLKIGGGVVWHELVLWCIANNYGGIENLSLIPGTVGAAPIQNIGAYGVELKDVFVRLEAMFLQTGDIHSFEKEDCNFGYRNSVFKNKLKGKYCITTVTLALSKNNHQINSSYGAIRNTLSDLNIEKPTIKNVSDAVIAIRSSKLPDPKVLGNSGSFFKNPEIPMAQLLSLKAKFPNIVFYDLPNDMAKVPAGWLIEQCGWKGKRIGNTGSYAKQALVLVNYGNAKGENVKQLAFDIIASVNDKFGILLTPEVNIL